MRHLALALLLVWCAPAWGECIDKNGNKQADNFPCPVGGVLTPKQESNSTLSFYYDPIGAMYVMTKEGIKRAEPYPMEYCLREQNGNQIFLGDGASEKPSHNCSLLTVARNGTVSVVYDLTKERAKAMEKYLTDPEINDGVYKDKDGHWIAGNGSVSEYDIERTGVFCE
jgi:hypothetical protein